MDNGGDLMGLWTDVLIVDGINLRIPLFFLRILDLFKFFFSPSSFNDVMHERGSLYRRKQKIGTDLMK